jgi:hypothetical protein
MQPNVHAEGESVRLSRPVEDDVEAAALPETLNEGLGIASALLDCFLVG